MPKYMIERTVPGASELSHDQLRELASHSNDVLHHLGPDIRWIHSYVAGDKIYCINEAHDAEIIREHARRGGFPVDHITAVAAVIDPTTGEQ